jgi:hypothetical protein
MTARLDPHEIYTDAPEPVTTSLLRSRVMSILSELESLAPLLPTLPEMTDADEALRVLRHLRKQLESE